MSPCGSKTVSMICQALWLCNCCTVVYSLHTTCIVQALTRTNFLLTVDTSIYMKENAIGHIHQPANSIILLHAIGNFTGGIPPLLIGYMELTFSSEIAKPK